MKRPTHQAPLQVVATGEPTRESLALLDILALGNRQIEEGKVTLLEEVARRLRSRGSNSRQGPE